MGSSNSVEVVRAMQVMLASEVFGKLGLPPFLGHFCASFGRLCLHVLCASFGRLGLCLCLVSMGWLQHIQVDGVACALRVLDDGGGFSSTLLLVFIFVISLIRFLRRLCLQVRAGISQLRIFEKSMRRRSGIRSATEVTSKWGLHQIEVKSTWTWNEINVKLK